MNFVNIDTVRKRYSEIAEAYIEAFKGDPWWEVSKCADVEQRCPGGLSPLDIGEFCVQCSSCPTKPAYTAEQLVEGFEALNEQRPLQWYLEDSTKGLSMAALAWRAPSGEIAKSKYSDEPEMGGWLQERFGDQDIIWLDEVFANKKNKEGGNLSDFAAMCRGFGELLGPRVLAYRTKTPQMLEAANRDFGPLAELTNDMPDLRKRTFVTISLNGDMR